MFLSETGLSCLTAGKVPVGAGWGEDWRNRSWKQQNVSGYYPHFPGLIILRLNNIIVGIDSKETH